MAEDGLGKAIIFRLDPEKDAEPTYAEYGVPYKGSTILNILSYIYENLDSTFAFRKACSKGICRCCIVQVNGKPVMACMEPASEYMKIEPHAKFEVIKDLIVDFERPKK